MKFWNDKLRICPSCKAAVKLKGEERRDCPKCGETVWFFHYKPVEPPPEIPEPRPVELWKNPTTTLLLGAAGMFGIATIIAVNNSGVAVGCCALAAIGFAVFGFMRHEETIHAEAELKQASMLSQYAARSHKRVDELTLRFNLLLQTGDDRITQYYRTIFLKAEDEKKEADRLLRKAERLRSDAEMVEERINLMASQFVEVHLKWYATKLRPDPDNYQRNKTHLIRAFDFVESVGYDLPSRMRKQTFDKLKQEYKQKVREKAAKDEQRRIKKQLQEEAKIRREREQEQREAEQRERELQEKLDAALREHRVGHEAEIEALQAQLAEAQASTERAKSMAQLTKAGHVYILSNIGSLGEGRYKVGMTRRIDPNLRVKELGDASVPFPFDVHAMFSCENAPALENALHRELARYRVNRVNLRKEYFEVDLDLIIDAVARHHGDVEYVAEPEALEFRESETISPDELVATVAELEELGVSYDDDAEDDGF